MSSLFGISGNGASASFYDHTIDNSVRFGTGSPWLTRTPSSSGDQKKWTTSFWVKRAETGVGHYLWAGGAYSGNNGIAAIYFNSDDKIHTYYDTTGTNPYGKINDKVYRDTAAWYHIVWAVDAANTSHKIWVNGVEQTIIAGRSPPNYSYGMNRAGTVQKWGEPAWGAGAEFQGCLAEFVHLDGQYLTHTSFGEFKEGIWVPKEISGLTFGTNGFHLDFSNSGDLGNDVSGNNIDLSTNDIASTDQILDTPTNNFCTLDPLSSGSGVFSEGNLKYVSTTDTGNGTFGITSGKAYFEVYIGGDTNIYVGIIDISDLNPNRGGSWSGHGAIAYRGNGTQYALPKGGGSAVTSYGASLATGDIVGVAFDVDADTVTFYKNNSSQGNTTNGPSHISSNGVYSFVVYGDNDTYIVNTGQDSSFAGTKTAQGNTDANGIGDFYYAPPSGYLALCTSNLPELTIGPNSVTQADDHFNTVIYSGSNSAQTITTGLQPDWIWIKVRSLTGYHNLTDTSRGITRELYSNTTDAETNVGRVASTSSTGFTLANSAYGYTNESGQTFVSWNWHANGGTTSSNTDGSITSTVQANTTAGFSIVTYTGTGSAGTIGHGLGAVPDVVFVRRRDSAGSWQTYITDISTSTLPEVNGRLHLEGTNAALFDSYTLEITSTTVKPTNLAATHVYWNTSSGTYLMYCFKEVEGYSKFGSYTGNGSTDGAFVFTGFRPAWLLIKRTDSADDWFLTDSIRNPLNPTSRLLDPNTSNAEYYDGTTDNSPQDFLSNGFKYRSSNANWNASGGTYIYMAFAEAPFKYANAR